MFIDRREHLLNMKNKYLTKCLCITMAAAVSMNGPVGIFAADEASLSGTETVIQTDETQGKTSADEAAPTVSEAPAEADKPSPEPTEAPSEPAEPTEAPAEPTVTLQIQA